jgi:hypothetical protein
MELEALCIQLGIPEHIPALSEWRDDLIREKATEIQNVHIATESEKSAALAELAEFHAEKIVEKDAEIYALKNPDNAATAYFKSLPAEIQEEFAPDFEICGAFFNAGRKDLAEKHVLKLTLPAELEPLREAMIAAIQQS